MKTVNIRFFAVFKEHTGLEIYRHETSAETLMNLYQEMAGIFSGLNIEAAALVAVNDDLANWSQQFDDGDEVLFFPPVAGG